MAEYDKNGQSLATFPDDISPDCEELLLYANKIKKVPASIGTLTKLKVLNCFNNSIGLSLPNEIGSLGELTEVNFAANRLAMLKEVHFASWAKVTVLNLNDNNLTSMGSLAPLVALEELRIYGNQLTELPLLGDKPELKIYESHKNQLADGPEDYFSKTPALERLSIWGNKLTKLPSSLATACPKLVGVQAHENPNLTSIPDGPWSKSLETIFLQDTQLKSLPASLAACPLKRVNIKGVACDDALAAKMEKLVLSKPGAIFWDRNGKQERTPG